MNPSAHPPARPATPYVNLDETAKSPPAMPDFMTPAEVAAAARVSVRSVERWLKSGRLPGVRLGPKTWRILRADVHRFLNG